MTTNKAVKNMNAASKSVVAKKKLFDLPLHKSADCPIGLLQLDISNPRLQTGLDIEVNSEDDLILILSDIAALDELITSIFTNKYLNLEPMIVIEADQPGQYRVLEGNRRLASIKLLRDPALAKRLGLKVPGSIPKDVIDSTVKVLCFRVTSEDEARAFIGFKHINGPQRWEAYAKARYVTDWYKNAQGNIKISEIAARMGDTNDTMRSYIYSMLTLDQAADEKVWEIRDRTNTGRFAFSHFYTALGRKEYQEYLGVQDSLSDQPPIKPIAKSNLKVLGEVLSYIYGSKSADQPALVRSQNPDLKDLGLAITNNDARIILANKGTLDEARDAMKNPNTAFHDAVITSNMRLKRALDLLPKYDGSDSNVNAVVEEAFERADTLHTMTKKKKGYPKDATS